MLMLRKVDTKIKGITYAFLLPYTYSIGLCDLEPHPLFTYLLEKNYLSSIRSNLNGFGYIVH